MTQEQKDLLLKDLCGRLPYGTKCKYYDYCEGDYDEGTIKGFERQEYIQIDGRCIHIEEVKPYLFPLSSMTEEQKEELLYNYLHNDIYFDDFNDYFLAGELWHDLTVSIDALPALINWLNKNHFDYRNLILKGLAIDATGKNIY